MVCVPLKQHIERALLRFVLALPLIKYDGSCGAEICLFVDTKAGGLLRTGWKWDQIRTIII